MPFNAEQGYYHEFVTSFNFHSVFFQRQAYFTQYANFLVPIFPVFRIISLQVSNYFCSLLKWSSTILFFDSILVQLAVGSSP